MKKYLVFCLFLLLFADIVMATEYIDVKSVNISLFGGLVESNDDMYVSSMIVYSILLNQNNETKATKQNFDVIIFNPSNEVIENSTYIFTEKNSNMYIGSNISLNEWKLIYADVPGIYKLVLSSDKYLFLENISGFSRHALELPFYFEVKSLQEKRIMDLTQNTFMASIAMLIVAIMTLISTSDGKNAVKKTIIWGFIILASLYVLVYIFISLKSHYNLI